MKKELTEKEIEILIKKSFQETEKSLEIGEIKKKYLEKGGLIPQFFQQIVLEKDL